MAFIRRLGWYLVGFSIGLVFLFFFLNKKSEETNTSFCYFPNCRVLKELRSKPITYSEEAREDVQGNRLDSLAILQFLQDGDIDFGKSDTKTTPCKTYVVRNSAATSEMTLKNCPGKVIISRIQKIRP